MLLTRWLLMVGFVVVLIAGCSGDDEDPTRTTNQTGATATTAATNPPVDEPTETSAPAATATDSATETEAATATSAPTSTTTATSTPEPTATPEASPPDIQVMKSKTGQPNSIGAFTVDGYVQNLGETAAQEVQVVVSLYDATGTILGSNEASVPAVITAGAQAPFTAYIGDVDFNAVAETRFLTQFQPLDPDSFGGSFYITTFEVPQINWTGAGWAGEVTNTGEAGAEFVTIYAASLDAAGEVIVVNFGYSDLDALNPGVVSPFTIRTDSDLPAPTSTIVYVIGHEL